MADEQQSITNLGLDLYGCDSEKMGDKEFLKSLIGETAEELSMKQVIDPKVRKNQIGLSASIGLSTSHIVINTYPEGRAAFIVISSCGQIKQEDITKYLSSKIDARFHESTATGFRIPEGPHKVLSRSVFGRDKLRLERLHETMVEVNYQRKPIYTVYSTQLPLFMSSYLENGLPRGIRRLQDRNSRWREFHFQPQGETKMRTEEVHNQFYHTWPEYGFEMRHVQQMPCPRCLTLFDGFFYVWHP